MGSQLDRLTDHLNAPLRLRENIGGYLLGVVILAVIIAFVVTRHSGSEANGSRVTACASVAGSPTAVVEVSNTSHEARSYFVTVAFSSRDGVDSYGTGTNAAGTVEPGQSASVQVVASGSVSGDVACKVTEVTTL